MAVQPFLQSYVFQHAFESSHKNQQDKRARAACLALARKIPAGPVDAAFLTAFAGCFGKTNRSATAAVLDAALRSPTTANALRDSMFRPMLDTLPLVQGAQQAKVAHLLASCCISSKASDLLASACEPAQGVSQLRKAYSAVQPQDLDTRYDILFASFSLLSAAFPPAGLDPDRNLDRFLEVLTPAMEDASISDSKAPSWLADLETEFQYSSKLQESAGVDTRSDPRFEYLVQILQSFAATQSVSQLIASRVLQNGERSGSAEKGKARHVDGVRVCFSQLAFSGV